MNAPESDSAKQELERAATMILAELNSKGQLPSGSAYERLHALVAVAYGRGYVAGANWTRDQYERGMERVARALRELT